jgi:nucleotide-binding universal stress UspA family protein
MLRNLVVGTDFSPCSQQALELALGLARDGAARVALVHVCELGADDLDDQRLLSGEQALCRLVAEQRHRGAEVTGVLRSGRPWQKLDNVAVEVGAGLIVIGRHGAGRGPCRELGSVAEQLVRSASRPVLLAARDLDARSQETPLVQRRNRR